MFGKLFMLLVERLSEVFIRENRSPSGIPQLDKNIREREYELSLEFLGKIQERTSEYETIQNQIGERIFFGGTTGCFSYHRNFKFICSDELRFGKTLRCR